MGVRLLQCLSVGIISILSFTSLSYAQQNLTLRQPLITLPPGVGTKQTHSRAYHLGGPTTPIAPMTLEPSIFPLFIEDHEISSLVTLINSSGISSSALLTIRDQQGKAYAPVSIPVVAHAKVQIKVADLIQKIRAHVRTGSILVTQGPELTRPSILGQLTLSETTAVPVALTEEELVMPMLFDSQDLLSISESATDAQLIAVTSLSTEPQHITAQCYKKGSVATKTATIAPGGTALLYPCSTDSSHFEGISLLGASETTESAGISLHSDGPNGGFAAFGLARHTSPGTKSNFLGSLQFIDPTSLHSSALVFTGVSAGYSLAPGAHPYSAAVALANFSAQQSHITIAFHKTEVNGSVSSTTKDVVLAPQSSTQVPLAQLGLKAGEIGSLIVSSDQQPGDLMAKIVSSSDSAPNQLEQLAKDALSYRNGGAHPWTLQDNARSDLVLFNHSSRIEPFNVLITTEDGAQWTKQLKLAPFETRTVSINDLISDKTPDSYGRTLPATTWSGSVVWHTGGPGIGSGHVLIRSEANSTGENFSCDQVYVVCGAWADASPTTMSVGDTGIAAAGEDVCVEWGTVGTCGGDFDYSQNWGASWTSGDSSIVSVTDNTWQATYAGNALGTTYLIGFVSDSWGCSANAYTPDISVVAPDNTPVLSGIDPSDWPADGTAYQVTFTGLYFGTNQPNLTFSDSTISYSLLSYNDTQIVAYVTVPSGTPDEDVNVSITSDGYYGRTGFLSGGGQRSPSSAPVQAAVGAPRPNNLQLTSPEDEGNGFLHMTFTWGSTSGNLSDLSACQVRENVTYPTAGNATCPNDSTKQCYWPPSPPWPPTNQSGTAWVNPTLVSGPANVGGVTDNNTITNLNFVKPYSQSSFQATQIFEYSCSAGPWTKFGNTYTITRQVTQQSSQWVFKVSKSGISFSSTYVLP